MKNLTNFDLCISTPDIVEYNFTVEAEQKERLDQIRKASNVIQALENAVVQCDDQPAFEQLKQSLQGYLRTSREKLRELIHSV